MSDDNHVPARSQSIQSIVKQIDDEELYLPEFQRNFVWDLEQSIDLFDSLVKDIHIGSLIYGKAKFGLTVRKFDKSKRGEKKTSKAYILAAQKERFDLTDKMIKEAESIAKSYILVLDGQQRLTSIYRAVKGFDDIWFIAKNNPDLILNCRVNEKKLVDCLDRFSAKDDKNALSIKLSDVFGNSNAMDNVKKKLFNNTKFGASLSDEDKELYFDAYHYLFSQLVNFFNKDSLVSYFLLDMNLDQFILFFERSNSRGIALNFIDILVAKVYSGFHLREKLDDFRIENNYELIPEVVVRAMAYLKSKGHDIDKNYVLKNLTAEDLNRYWPDITLSYKKVVDYLKKNNYINNINDLPYQNMLIPLVLVANSFKDHSLDNLNEKQAKVLDWWYWSVSFSKHYTTASNESIMLDSGCLTGMVKNKVDMQKFEKFFSELKPKFESAEDVSALNVSRNPIYTGIMNLVVKKNKGIINWESGNYLSSPKIDSHHILPKDYLKQKKIPAELIDRVVNRVFIYKITNIKIRNNPPSKYLVELEGQNTSIRKNLSDCLIPNVDKLMEGGYDDDYEAFLNDRAEMLYNYIDETVLSKTDEIKEYCFSLSSDNHGDK